MIYLRTPSYRLKVSPPGEEGEREAALLGGCFGGAAPARAPARHPGTERGGRRGFPWLPPMQIPPGERRLPDSPPRPLGGSAPRSGLPGRAIADPRLPPPQRPAPLRSAPHGAATGSSNSRRRQRPAEAAAITHRQPPSPAGREWNIQNSQRISGWTVLGAKCCKFVSATLRL